MWHEHPGKPNKLHFINYSYCTGTVVKFTILGKFKILDIFSSCILNGFLSVGDSVGWSVYNLLVGCAINTSKEHSFIKCKPRFLWRYLHTRLSCVTNCLYVVIWLCVIWLLMSFTLYLSGISCVVNHVLVLVSKYNFLISQILMFQIYVQHFVYSQKNTNTDLSLDIL